MAVSNEEKLLKERIRHMLSYKRMSISKIAEGNETLRVKLGRQINGEDTSVQFSVLYMLLYMFPDIDANWLILGEGLMKKTTDSPRIYNNHTDVYDNGSNTTNYGETNLSLSVRMLLDEKDKRIAELEADKKHLQGLLSALTANAQSLVPKPKK